MHLSSLSEWVANLEYDDVLLKEYIHNFYAGGPQSVAAIHNIDQLSIRKFFIC